MKRDMELIREILLQIERNDSPRNPIQIEIENTSAEIISYHIELLDEARLINAKDLSDTGGYEWQAINLTWSGHEFLDASRNSKIWDGVLGSIREKGIGLGYEALKFMLIEATKAALT